jgi:hypothetical protein
MRPARPAALLAAALVLTACGTSAPPVRHPSRLSVPATCRKLRADVLASGGTPTPQQVLHLIAQRPGDAGNLHGAHGLGVDLDWTYTAVTARNRGTAAGRQFTARWQGFLARDCMRAARVVVPVQGQRRPVALAPAAGVKLTRR